jgi:hypothetical protein
VAAETCAGAAVERGARRGRERAGELAYLCCRDAAVRLARLRRERLRQRAQRLGAGRLPRERVLVREAVREQRRRA